MAQAAKKPPGPLGEAIADILRRRLMGELGHPKTALAKATGLSPSMASRVIRGKQRVDVEDLDYICYALGLKLSDVIEQAEANVDSRAAEQDWPAARLPKK